MVKEAKATMPPFIAVLGPMDYDEAERMMLDTNHKLGFKTRRPKKRRAQHGLNGHTHY